MTKILNYLPKPHSSFLQWHITERCNLRCKHCYQTSYETPEMPLPKMLSIVDEYIELLDLWGIEGRMQVTGGEPFVRKDIFDVLEKIHENRNKLMFTIMSNGFYVTRDIAKKLKDLNINNFQISIEGEAHTNDYIRGKGAFKKITEAAKILVEEGIHTSLSFTVTSINSKEYFKVLEIAKSLGVQTLWSDRLVPWGSGKQIQEQMLQPLDVKEHYEKITRISKDLERNGSKTRLSRNRTLYFMADPKKEHDRLPWANHCDGVGTRGMTVLCDGTVYPCRRLPIKVGNLMEQSLFEIWYGNEWMWKLRDKNNYKNEKCGNCELFERCGGGAPCIAYGYSGTPFATDPQCWKAFDKILPAEELARAAQIAESDKEPEYWEHVIVQDTGKDLGEHFELDNGRIYYCNGIKTEVSKIKEENPSGLYLLNIDLNNFNIDEILNKIENKKIKKLFVSIRNNQNSTQNKNEALFLLGHLKNKNVNFKLTRPLPRGWFGFDYFRVSRALNAPQSWKDSMELFYIENEQIKIRNIINIDGPKLKYMPSRNQIYEYFSYFYNRPRRMQKPKEELIKVKAVWG
ncbi:radical SAM protein [Candidatus Woesearchaeota archaeon]|nr:radical SAM protein [Candidatus Woesearchaeota archaeon]